MKEGKKEGMKEGKEGKKEGMKEGEKERQLYTVSTEGRSSRLGCFDSRRSIWGPTPTMSTTENFGGKTFFQ